MSQSQDAADVVPNPDYAIEMVGHAIVMRRMGSERTHLVDVPRYWLEPTTWIGPAYWALHEPAAALCGAVLRPDHRGLVAMRLGTRVKCKACLRRAHTDGHGSEG